MTFELVWAAGVLVTAAFITLIAALARQEGRHRRVRRHLGSPGPGPGGAGGAVEGHVRPEETTAAQAAAETEDEEP
jgi:hypothetical protein